MVGSIKNGKYRLISDLEALGGLYMKKVDEVLVTQHPSIALSHRNPTQDLLRIIALRKSPGASSINPPILDL